MIKNVCSNIYVYAWRSSCYDKQKLFARYYEIKPEKLWKQVYRNIDIKQKGNV